MAFTVVRLNDLINEVGEKFLMELFSDFSCPVNEERTFHTDTIL